MAYNKNNKKYFIPFCVFLLGSILTWGTWVTSGIYSAKADTVTVAKGIEGINKNLELLRKEQKEIREGIKENRSLVYEKQEEMLKILIKINKKVKDDNKRK